MGPRLRREGAEQWKPSRATKTREGGDKKELQGYTTKGRRTTGCLNSSLVAYAYRRTRASRSYQQRPECLPKDQSVKKLSTKARVPTEGPERQQVINQGQSAYRRSRASTSYQQRPECLLKDRSVKKVSAKARGAKLERTTNERHDGNHTRIGCSYTMEVPMNISSHREVGDLTGEKKKGERDPYQNKKERKKQTTR